MNEPPTIILTGATGAIGRELAGALSPRFPLLLGCRDTTRAEDLAATLPGKVKVGRLDLADPESVRDFAASVPTHTLGPLVLLNNAGVMQRRYAADAQGRELSTRACSPTCCCAPAACAAWSSPPP